MNYRQLIKIENKEKFDRAVTFFYKKAKKLNNQMDLRILRNIHTIRTFDKFFLSIKRKFNYDIFGGQDPIILAKNLKNIRASFNPYKPLKV